jgi:gamma-glutamylputrescine oxidase
VTGSPLWLEKESEPIRSAAFRGAVDIAIVGGGVTGCAAAWSLARAGRRVRLHEARQIAGGASGRNGGFALRGAAMAYDHAVRDHGPDAAHLLWKRSEDALHAIRDLAGDALRPVGSFRLAADDDEAGALREEYEAIRQAGFDVDWLDPLPVPLCDLFVSGIGHPTDGALQPARWVRRLARAAAEAGAEIREHSRVSALAQLDAEHVLLATDGYVIGLVASDRCIAPTRGQVVATAPLDRMVFPTPCYARYGLDYWHQTSDRRLVYGGHRDASPETEGTMTEGINDPVQRAIGESVAELLGSAPAITHRWSGIFGSTADLLPLVGRVPDADRIWVAAGYSGHGNVLGFACGELVAAAILGRPDPLLDLFDPGRLPGSRP